MTTDMRQNNLAENYVPHNFFHDLKKPLNGELPAGTGLESLPAFLRTLTRELARAQRGYSSGGVVVLLGFDNFGSVCERHGNAAAKACIKLISGILAGEIRAMDTAARLNDEEFILLLPDTSSEKSSWRMQNLLLRLNNLSLIWQLREIQISVSLTMKAYGPEAVDLKTAV